MIGVLEFKGRKLFALSVKVSVSDYVYNIYYERKRQVYKSQESTIGGFDSDWDHQHGLYLVAGYQGRVLLFQQ